MKSILPPVVRLKGPVITRDGQLGMLGQAIHGRSRRRSVFPVAMSVSSWPENGHSKFTAPVRAVAADFDVRLYETYTSSGVPENNAEKLIEKVIYGCRFFTLLAVSGSLVGSFLCFLKGSVIIVGSFVEYFIYRAKVMSMLIEAIDIYLLGTVMIVFGVGLYEIFISNLDIAKMSTYRSNLFGMFTLQERPKWLTIKSVNELKTKLGHVIVMILLLGLFEKSKKVMITTPRDLFCFAASILFSSCGLYLLSMLKK